MHTMRSRWMFLSLITLAVTVAVAACGGKAEEPASAPTQPPTAAPTRAATPVPTPQPQPTPTPTPVLPKRGGILRTRIQANPNPWNILQGPITASYPLFQPVLSSLVQFDLESQRMAGDLAESWQVSADGKQLTFRIRQGVRWHDGTPMKAADIKFNLDAVFFRTLGFQSHLQGFLTAVAAVETPDDVTLRITLKTASNSFFRNLAHAMMLNYAPHVSQDELKAGKVVGTNAFAWARWEKDRKIEERAYPGYFVRGADGRTLPYLDGIDFFVITDTTAHLAAFRTGQLDAFDHVNASALAGQIEIIRKDIPNLIAGGEVGGWRMLLLKNRPPFNDIRLRKAIQLGIDRVAFTEAGIQGAGVPAGMAAGPPQDSGGLWAPSLKDQQRLPGIGSDTKRQDIAEAERLLAAAGFTASSPLRVNMYVTSSGTRPDEAAAATTLLNRVKGLQIEVKPEETAVHDRRLVIPGGEFDLIYRAFGQAVDDPSHTIGLFWISGASRNYGEWADAQVDQWYNEQETTQDAAQRSRLVQLINERLYDQAYNTVLAWSLNPWVKRGDVKGLSLGGAFDNRGRFDKAWFDR